MKTRLAAAALAATALVAVTASPAAAQGRHHHHKATHASCSGLTIALMTKTICVPL